MKAGPIMLPCMSARHSHSRKLVFHSLTNKNSLTTNNVKPDKASPDK